MVPWSDQDVDVMDPRLIPLFKTKGDRVEVKKNGFRIGNVSYGRFNQELRNYETVQVFTCEGFPQLAYVVELGGFVERYQKEKPGGTEQYERKRAVEKGFRNRHEAAMQTVIANGVDFLDECTHTVQDPTPQRRAKTVAPETLVARVEGIKRGMDLHKEQEAELVERTTFDRRPAASIDDITIDRSARRSGSGAPRRPRVGGGNDSIRQKDEPSTAPRRRNSLATVTARYGDVLSTATHNPTEESESWHDEP